MRIAGRSYTGFSRSDSSQSPQRMKAAIRPNPANPSQDIAPQSGVELPTAVALLGPRITVPVVAIALPEARPILFHEFQPIGPLGALPEVEARDHQPEGTSVGRLQV